MDVLDLFSGIGAFSLGLERAGMHVVAFCESDAFCRRVLRRHWPAVPIWHDVRTLTGNELRSAGIAPDVICGGFPCEDISVAGKGAGLAGKRSGLWSEYARLVRELRPRYVLVENVAILLGRGLGRVVGDLAALGYDAEWHCIPAAAVGAPHLRDRVWIVAYPGGDALRHQQQRLPGGRSPGVCDQGQAESGDDGAPGAVADADGGRREGQRLAQHGDEQRASRHQPDGCGAPGRRAWSDVPDADIARRIGGAGPRSDDAGLDEPANLGVAGGPRLAIGPGTLRQWALAATSGTGWWAVEPDVGRVVDGLASKLDRRKRLIALGNALVPAIPEILGRAIMKERT